MRLIAGHAERGPVISSAVVLGALAGLVLTVVLELPVLEVAPLLVLAVVALVAYRSALGWRSLLALIILVILFIPIRRYRVPGTLPFELEPYRLLVAFVVAAWSASLLVDVRVRLRKSGIEGPLLLFVVAVLASLLLNPGRVNALEAEVVKKLTFFASFLLVFYLIVSVARAPGTIDFLLRVLTAGGAVIAVLAVVEARTGYNAFDHLSGIIPFLRLDRVLDLARGGRLRVYASAQHPIALGALLVMLVPLAIYLARRSGRRRWWLVAALLGLGAVATVSRTSILMLLVVGLVFLWLRPRETKRLAPLLLPALLVAHLALPGTVGSLKDAFFPHGGLIAEQQQGAGTRGSGRIADLGPTLDEVAKRPLFGQGFGTAVSGTKAQILDDQWLGILLETGIAGVAAWVWLLARSARRLGREAKKDASDRGWLLTALAAAVAAYAVGMLTFDAFSFVQVTFVFFILLAFGAASVSGPVPASRAPARAGSASAAAAAGR